MYVFVQNFKFVVSSLVVQKVGAGLHSSTSTYWDASTDGKFRFNGIARCNLNSGSVTVKWENDTIACIVVVFGCAL